MGCFVLAPTSTYSKVLKDDVFVKSTKSYTLEEVCKKMVGKVYPLISKHDLAHVDCMKKKIRATSFCLEQQPEDPYLARGKVFKDNVECISSSRIIFKYQCGKNDDLCFDHEIGCFKVKENLAARLQIAHSSKVKGSLNCYFSKNEKIDSFYKSF